MPDQKITRPAILRTGMVTIGKVESRIVCLQLDGEVEAVAIDAGIVSYGKDVDSATVLLAAGKGQAVQVTGWHVLAHEENPEGCGRPWKGRLIQKS